MPLMKYGDTPRAAFSVNPWRSETLHSQIPTMMAAHLSARFSASRAKRRLKGTWIIKVKADQGKVRIYLARSQFAANEWRLLAGSWQIPSFYIRRKPTRFGPALLQVCREIHSFLSPVEGVTDLRWYFEGSEAQTSAVSTPDDLPWHDS